MAEVASLLDSAARGECLLLAHALLLVEFASVLLKKRKAGSLTPAEMKGLVDDVRQMPVRLFPHAPLLDAAVDLAQAHGLSAYDATFLALARLEDCPLVTADERLAARAKRLGAH